MAIHFVSQTPGYQPDNIILYKTWLKRVIESEKRKLGEIEYIFTNKEWIVKINSNFLNHNYPTDIITFDNSYLHFVEGEIYICIDVVKENSIKHSEGIFKKELDRVIVHGVLHLVGYKDESEEEKRIMRRKEDLYLEYLD